MRARQWCMVASTEMERSGRRDEGFVLKKGPWTAEEDQVLLEFVRMCGPRDWSSIKAKGLLPRSGKSCRLRYVNKLKPDLKTGCKFSTEEERTVLDLQARFGNKWARIATYLPGRTDNDVKNFWSTRQKRLARMRLAAAQKKPQRNHSKQPLTTAAASPVATFQDPGEVVLHPPVGQEYTPTTTGECSSRLLGQVQPDVVQDPVGAPSPLQQEEFFDRKSFLLDTLPQFSFPQLPHALLDLPVLPEYHDMDLGGLVDNFGFQDPFAGTVADATLFQLPIMGPQGGECSSNVAGEMETVANDHLPDEPDSFFNDFPIDMLDDPDLPPPPSPSPPPSSAD